MSDLKSVSVIVAAHDAEAFLASALESALAQGGVDVAVLVVDDASSDGTAAMVERHAQSEPRLSLLRCPRNMGPAGARNLALDAAAGDWVSVLDSDDSYAPGRLARMCALGEREAADIVLDDFLSVDAMGRDLGWACLSERRGRGPITLEDWLRLNDMRPGVLSFGYAKPMISRRFLTRTGLRYNELLRNGEDFHLVLEALAAGARVVFSGDRGYRYTRRDGSVSRRAKHDEMRALLDADLALIARLAPEQVAATKPLFKARHENLARLVTTEEVLGALKSGRPVAAMAGLAGHPAAVGRVLRHLREAVQKRLVSGQ